MKRHISDPMRMQSQRLVMSSLVCGLLIALSGACGGAQKVNPHSPVGLWKSVDDQSGEAKSLVRIFTEKDRLYGKIEKLLGGVDPRVQCIKCKGEKRGARVIGLVIIEGLKENGDEWNDGTILDPKSGKSYRCSIKVRDDGTRLEVRGYIGISLLGRTQSWYRVE